MISDSKSTEAANPVVIRAGAAGEARTLQQRFATLLNALLDVEPGVATWWTQNRQKEITRVVHGASVGRLFEGAEIDWVDGKPADAPTHRLRLMVKSGREAVGHAQACLSAAGSSRSAMLLTVDLRLSFRSRFAPRSGGDPDWFVQCCKLLRPDWATWGGPAGAGGDTPPRLGWWTYLSGSEPVPDLPSPSTCSSVDDKGWLIIAHPELPDPSNPKHAEALAHLRYFLGARVLQDGPAYPPPGHNKVVVVPAVPNTHAPQAPTETPSYLRPPTPVPPAPPTEKPVSVPALPALSQTPPLVSAPTYGQTTEVDVAAILRASTPFRKGASRPSAEAPREASPQSPVPSASRFSTGTDEIDVDEILKGLRGPVPFEGERPKPPKTTALPAMPDPPAAQAPNPLSASTPASPTSPKAPTGRLVRFDPQTGAPLAVPYWEDLTVKGKP